MHFILFGLGPPPANYWIPLHASAAVFEVTLWDQLQLAVGPSLWLGGDGPVSPAGKHVFGGGGTARVNVAFSRKSTSSTRRSGLSLGILGQVAWFAGGGQLTNVGVVVGAELF